MSDKFLYKYVSSNNRLKSQKISLCNNNPYPEKKREWIFLLVSFHCKIPLLAEGKEVEEGEEEEESTMPEIWEGRRAPFMQLVAMSELKQKSQEKN